MIKHGTHKHPTCAANDKPQTVAYMGLGLVIVAPVYTPDGMRALYFSQTDSKGTVGASADAEPETAPDLVLDFGSATRIGAIHSLDVIIDACTRLRDALRIPERRSA